MATLRNRGILTSRKRLMCASTVLRAFPLRGNRDYERAISLIEPLVLKKLRSHEEDNFLEVMTVLIERYDEEHFPIGSKVLSGVALLRHLLES